MSPKAAERGAVYFPRLAAERLVIALCRASSAVARAAEARADETGTGVGQHLVLKMLAEAGPSSQRVLSDELRIDRSVMVGLCDSLERAGHVRRERDAGDRRAHAVTLTDSAAGCSTMRRTRSPSSSTPPSRPSLRPSADSSRRCSASSCRPGGASPGRPRAPG